MNISAFCDTIQCSLSCTLSISLLHVLVFCECVLRNASSFQTLFATATRLYSLPYNMFGFLVLYTLFAQFISMLANNKYAAIHHFFRQLSSLRNFCLFSLSSSIIIIIVVWFFAQNFRIYLKMVDGEFGWGGWMFIRRFPVAIQLKQNICFLWCIGNYHSYGWLVYALKFAQMNHFPFIPFIPWISLFFIYSLHCVVTMLS